MALRMSIEQTSLFTMSFAAEGISDPVDELCAHRSRLQNADVETC